MDALLLFFCFSCFLWVTTFPPLWRFTPLAGRNQAASTTAADWFFLATPEL